MDYKIFGPFELPRKREPGTGRLILNFCLENAIKPFWARVEKETKEPLRLGRGCYIFATRGGPGFRPWYVGQATNGFARRVFSHEETYNSVVDDKIHRTGPPCVFLIAKLTERKKLSKGRLNKTEANFIEQILINHAQTKNPWLKNKQKMKFATDLVVPGVFGDQRAPSKFDAATKKLRTVLGIR